MLRNSLMSNFRTLSTGVVQNVVRDSAWSNNICFQTDCLSINNKCPKGISCNYLHFLKNPQNKYTTFLKYNKLIANASQGRHSSIETSKLLSWDDVNLSKDQDCNWRWSESPEIDRFAGESKNFIDLLKPAPKCEVKSKYIKVAALRPIELDKRDTDRKHELHTHPRSKKKRDRSSDRNKKSTDRNHLERNRSRNKIRESSVKKSSKDRKRSRSKSQETHSDSRNKQLSGRKRSKSKELLKHLKSKPSLLCERKRSQLKEREKQKIKRIRQSKYGYGKSKPSDDDSIHNHFTFKDLSICNCINEQTAKAKHSNIEQPYYSTSSDTISEQSTLQKYPNCKHLSPSDSKSKQSSENEQPSTNVRIKELSSLKRQSKYGYPSPSGSSHELKNLKKRSKYGYPLLYSDSDNENEESSSSSRNHTKSKHKHSKNKSEKSKTRIKCNRQSITEELESEECEESENDREEKCIRSSQKSSRRRKNIRNKPEPAREKCDNSENESDESSDEAIEGDFKKICHSKLISRCTNGKCVQCYTKNCSWMKGKSYQN